MAMIDFPALHELNKKTRAAVKRPDVRVGAAVTVVLLVILTTVGAGASLLALAGFLVGLQIGAWRAANLREVRETIGAPVVEAPRVTAAAPSPLMWREIINALPEPAIAVDRDLRVVHANKVAFALFPAMQRGAPIALASRSPEMIEAIDLVLKDATPRSAAILERVPVERRLELTVAPLPLAGSGDPELLLVLRDASERDRLVQMRTDFIAHASHELRTPLSALRGFIETLQGPARNDVAARERFLGIMAAEAERMTRLLDDLLSLSRVEMRAHLAPTDRVDVGEIMIAVERLLQPVAAAANVTLQVEPPDGPRVIRGDHDEIVQMLVNLVQNAIKYGRREGKVVVKTSDVTSGRHPRVRISVIDEGAGIAEVHIPRLTERFYRVDDKTSRERGGTGLGLAIVKHILNRHDGRLEIQSSLGKGSTFTADIPLANGD